MDQKLQVKIERGKLWVEGELYSPQINCPQRETILDWQREERQQKMASYEILKAGEKVEIGKSTFQGFTAEIGTLEQVSDFYVAMRAHH